jgi:hypothetical protein
MFSKDAMADVIIEIVESKKDEIADKALEQLESKKEEISEKVDTVLDTTEETIEKTVEDTASKIEETVKNVLDKIDDNPQVAKALDAVEDIIGDQLDGREISCSCFGFLWLLRITRKTPQTSPSKPEENLNKSSIQSTPSIPVKEEVLPTVAPQDQTSPPSSS